MTLRKRAMMSQKIRLSQSLRVIGPPEREKSLRERERGPWTQKPPVTVTMTPGQRSSVKFVR